MSITGVDWTILSTIPCTASRCTVGSVMAVKNAGAPLVWQAAQNAAKPVLTLECPMII
jgi:hypothetical protein